MSTNTRPKRAILIDRIHAVASFVAVLYAAVFTLFDFRSDSNTDPESQAVVFTVLAAALFTTLYLLLTNSSLKFPRYHGAAEVLDRAHDEALEIQQVPSLARMFGWVSLPVWIGISMLLTGFMGWAAIDDLDMRPPYKDPELVLLAVAAFIPAVFIIRTITQKRLMPSSAIS